MSETEEICTCPVCGRLHRYLAANPPPVISGEAVIVTHAQHEALMAAVKELETIREEAAICGKMCCIYAEEPDANGQKSMSGCIVDSVAPFLVSIAYPLRDMCRHETLDKQAGVCRQCGIHEENIAALRAAGIQIEGK